jgi:hypothetical protein
MLYFQVLLQAAAAGEAGRATAQVQATAETMLALNRVYLGMQWRWPTLKPAAMEYTAGRGANAWPPPGRVRRLTIWWWQVGRPLTGQGPLSLPAQPTPYLSNAY